MLSYQHIYHAGNLADVHKHALLAVMLDYLTRKDKPLSYVETHAGRGLYALDAAEALKTGEAEKGIRLALARGWFTADHPYARALARTRVEFGPAAYPGSPVIAALGLRPGDRIELAELHPQEFAALEALMMRFGARCHRQDGLAFALSISPPVPRRGLVLIDPSYEVKADYETLPDRIAAIRRKWNVGIVALWYPILAGNPHLPMLAALGEGFRHEVRFPPARPGHGMTGSGLWIANPPWGIEAEAARLSALFAAL